MPQFNKHQQQVIDELEKNIVLSAGAGTGKTNVLSYRAANIIAQKKAAPQQILCLTFTNKACRELKQRIEQHIGAIAQQMTIRTIHGFAYKLITEQAKSDTKLFCEYTIFDDEDQKELVRSLQSKFTKTKNLNIMEIINAIEQLKQERYLADFFSDDAEADFTELYRRHLNFNRAFAHEDVLNRFFSCDGLKLAIAYESELRQMHGLDYKDLIGGAYRLLLDENVRSIWREKYKYIMIDEMQDTSEFEYRMLKNLFDGRNVMMCGDVFQTIYEWRGSKPKRVLADFVKTYRPLLIHFTENYRSTRLLLETARNLLNNLFPQQAAEPYIMQMIAKSFERGHKIKFKQFGSMREEAAWIFHRIRMLLPLVDDLSNIAVLTRNNAYIKNLSDELQKLCAASNAEIDFVKIDTVKFFRRKEVKDVLAVLKFLINDSDHLSLKRIAENIVPNIGSKTIDKVRQDEYLSAGIRMSDFLYNSGDPFDRLIKAYTAGDIVVFDIEGTGTDTLRDDIIQLSALRLHRGTVSAEFDCYLHTDKSVGDSEKVHHISDEFLEKHGEDARQVLEKFTAFMRNAIIVGHNIRGYDMQMLNSNLARHGLVPVDFTNINFDTLDMVRRFYPNLPSHKLEYLSEYFDFTTKSSHNSLDDVKATASLLAKLIEDKIIPTSRRRSELIEKQSGRFSRLKEIFFKLRQKLIEGASLKDMVASIVELFDLKYIYAYDTDEGRQRIENLRQLYRLADKELTSSSGRAAVAELLQYAALSASDLDAVLSDKAKMKVPLITIHQSKGLEFEYEFLAGLNEGVFPPYFTVQKGCVPEEEKRLFYVAVTRAKKELYISCTGRPSRLLENIPNQFLSDD